VIKEKIVCPWSIPYTYYYCIMYEPVLIVWYNLQYKSVCLYTADHRRLARVTKIVWVSYICCAIDWSLVANISNFWDRSWFAIDLRWVGQTRTNNQLAYIPYSTASLTSVVVMFSPLPSPSNVLLLNWQDTRQQKQKPVSPRLRLSVSNAANNVGHRRPYTTRLTRHAAAAAAVDDAAA